MNHPMEITKSKIFRQAIISSVLLVIYFLCTSQFWPHWWFVLILIAPFLLVFFLIIFVKCIISWIKDRKSYRRPYIPFCVTTLAILIVYFLPSYIMSKRYYKNTSSLCYYKPSNCNCTLYAEYYCVFGNGFMATDVNAKYLTDSVTFRKYLGFYDEGDEAIEVVCKGDTITVTKTSTEFISTMWSKPQILERKTYMLSALKKQHAFD